MPDTYGIFVYTSIDDDSIGLGTGDKNVDGNGFVNTTKV